MSNISLIDSIYFDNKFKIFDLKWNPVGDDLAMIDFKGRLKLVKLEGDEINVVKNYKISNESLFSLDYSNDGESSKILN